MTTEVLGKLTFSEVPDVNGLNVLLNGGGTPQISSGTLAARPAAGVAGRLYLATDTNTFSRDTGSAWVDIVPSIAINGTANEIVVTGTNPFTIGIADNPILSGTARVRLPLGTTAQRPGSPTAGDIRFNTSTSFTEEFNGAYWSPMGRVLQIVSGTIGALTTTSTIPYDNTAPLISEGAEMFSQSFTPLSATSRVVIQFLVSCEASANSSNNSIVAATFAGSTNIGSTVARIATSNRLTPIGNIIVHQPGSTATVTYSTRFGPTSGSTGRINTSSSGTFGGTLSSQYLITEIA